MSEVLDKYRQKTEYLQKLVGAYQDLVVATLSHTEACVKGDKDLEGAVDAMIARVKKAENIFQVQQIQRDFTPLCKKIDAYTSQKTASGGGGLLTRLGALFGSKASSGKPPAVQTGPGKAHGKIELVDSLREIVTPYVILLEGFSKGTLLLADEREPFYDSLREKRGKRFEGLVEQESNALSRSLYDFFINKSNEAGAVEQEREELKSIISSMAGYIQSLSISSESFGTKLDEYSRKITVATSLNDIKKIQHAILTETLEIQKANNAVREQLAESNRKINEAGEKIARLEKELEMARQEKSVDPLTKVYNRGYFDTRLEEAVKDFSRSGEPCCLIMMDIDHFKDFNDTYGHQAGDQVLRKVAELIKESVRASDTVARYGGEEFGVILYRSILKDAMKMAEKIRKNVGEHEFGVLDKTIHVTVSLGVTAFTGSDKTETIVQRADKGLYSAKEQGRNRAVSVEAR